MGRYLKLAFDAGFIALLLFVVLTAGMEPMHQLVGGAVIAFLMYRLIRSIGDLK